MGFDVAVVSFCGIGNEIFIYIFIDFTIVWINCLWFLHFKVLHTRPLNVTPRLLPLSLLLVFQFFLRLFMQFEAKVHQPITTQDSAPLYSPGHKQCVISSSVSKASTSSFAFLLT